MGRRKTQKEYIEEAMCKNTTVEVVGEYLGDGVKILHRCKMCGNEWSVAPGHILRGCGCPKCGRETARHKKTKSHHTYIQEVQELHPTVEVVDAYINKYTKILHRCKVDGYEWMIEPDNFLHGKGCPQCLSNRRKNTHCDYISRVNVINPDIVVLEKYIGLQTKILHKCKIDGYEWMALPNNILHGAQCPRCSNRERYTTKSFKDKLSLINDDIIILGEYVGCKTKILCKCKIDGHIWEALPTNLLNGCGCPVCNSSHGEKIISKYLLNNKISFIPQYRFDDCKNIKPLPFDFYLTDYNACVEFDGIQHFVPIDALGGKQAFEVRIVNDSIKNEFCFTHNIPLIRIRYDWDILSTLNDFLDTLTIQND